MTLDESRRRTRRAGDEEKSTAGAGRGAAARRSPNHPDAASPLRAAKAQVRKPPPGDPEEQEAEIVRPVAQCRAAEAGGRTENPNRRKDSLATEE